MDLLSKFSGKGGRRARAGRENCRSGPRCSTIKNIYSARKARTGRQQMKRFFYAGSLAATLAAGACLLGGCGGEEPAGAPPAPAAEAAAEMPAKDPSVPRGPAAVHRGPDVKYSVPEGVSVLMYHMIGSETDNSAIMSAENLRWQMEYLRDHGYHPITMQELADYVTKEAPLPSKPVCITFDDGYEDNYTIVYPLMKEFGFPWTVFVITGSVGQPNRMTWDQLAEMADSQTVTIASHTVTHPRLHNLPPDEVKREIVGAQQALKEHLGIDNPWIAYPYGDYDETVDAIAKAAGIRLAVTTDAGRVHAGSYPYELKRVWIGNEVTESHYAERLTQDDYAII